MQCEEIRIEGEPCRRDEVGHAHDLRQQFDRAVDVLTKHAALEGDRGASLYAQAGKLAFEQLMDPEVAQRHYDKAIAEYNTSLTLDPNRARALYGRGFAKSRKGEAPAGINDMTTATGIQPSIGSEFGKYGVR